MKKYYIIFISSLVLLLVVVWWIKINNVKNVDITITNVVDYQTTETTYVTSGISTTKKSGKSTKSTKSTKTAAKTTEISELSTTTDETPQTEEIDIYININSATSDELVQINGIGPHLAEKIIEYRNENGGFRNVDELINVSGIGEKILEKIRPFVYVENPVYEAETQPDEPPPEIPEQEIAEEVTEEEPTQPVLTLEDCAPIELNSADVQLLTLLPFVDEEVAEKIIELRQTIGGRFSHPYELLYLTDYGYLDKKKIAEIVKYVYVEGEDEAEIIDESE